MRDYFIKLRFAMLWISKGKYWKFVLSNTIYMIWKKCINHNSMSVQPLDKYLFTLPSIQIFLVTVSHSIEVYFLINMSTTKWTKTLNILLKIYQHSSFYTRVKLECKSVQDKSLLCITLFKFIIYLNRTTTRNCNHLNFLLSRFLYIFKITWTVKKALQF